MFLGDTSGARFNKFMPLVTYAVERQLATKQDNYWMQATALELSVLNMDAEKATDYCGASKICSPERWEREATAANLQKIYDKARENQR
jgi:hypothetical protein